MHKVALLLGSLLLTAPVAAKRPTLRVAFTVTDNTLVDPASARAAAAPLVKRIGRMAGERVSLSHIPRVESLAQRIRAKQVHFVIASSLVYARLSGELALIPLALARTAGQRSFRMLVLVRKGSGARKLDHLRGKTISANMRHRTGWIFLESRLHRLGARPDAFFDKIRSPVKSKSVIIDLLMGDVDACLTSDVGVAAMARLNPQVRTRFRAVARSAPLAMPVIFAVKGAPRVDTVKRVLLRLHRDPVGKQLLTVFRTERLVSVGKDAFKTYRALIKAYEKIRAPVKTR